MSSPIHREEFENISSGLADALDFCRTIGAEPGFSSGSGRGFENGGVRGVLGEVDFYTRCPFPMIYPTCYADTM